MYYCENEDCKADDAIIRRLNVLEAIEPDKYYVIICDRCYRKINLPIMKVRENKKVDIKSFVRDWRST